MSTSHVVALTISLVALTHTALADRSVAFKTCMNSKSPSVDVFFPQSKNFQNIISKSVRTNVKVPAAVARPSSERDVQMIVKCARQAGYPVCPRSGGHDFEGQSRCGGVMLDLIQLKSVSLNTASRVVKLQPAATLGEAVTGLYSQSRPSDRRCIPVGICPGVGVAGYILGGGHGPYSGLLGLTCDSLVSIRMVNEFGKIIKASRQTNKELFRAACGGSGGIFGVVTEFKLRTSSCAKFDRAVVFRYEWNVRDAGQIINRWFDYDQNNGNSWMRLEIPRGNSGEGLVGYGMCWNSTSTAECQSRFSSQAFFNTGTRKTILLEKARNVVDVQAFLGPDGGWARYKAKTPAKSLKNNRYHEAGDADGRLYQSAMVKIDGPAGRPSSNYWQKYANWCSNGLGDEAWSVCQWNPFVNSVKQSRDNFFPHRAANTITEYITAPIGESDRRFGRKRMHGYLSRYSIGIYSNYPEPADELPGAYPKLYWGKYLPKLKQLKLAHNPCNFFAKEQTVPGSWNNCSFPE